MRTQLPCPKGAYPSIFGPYLLWLNGWMDQDATLYEHKPRPRRQCVRLGRSSPPRKGAQPPVLGPCLLWPNGWMDEHATWYGSRARPRSHCVRRGPSSPTKGAQQHPLFSAHVYCSHGRSAQLLLSSCCLLSTSEEIGWEEHLQTDLFCVESDVKP